MDGGDEQQLMALLYAEHADAVYFFARRYVQDQQRAEDVVQETLLRAWRHIDKLDGNQGNPRSYLLTVARHVITDQWRADQRRPQTVGGDALLAVIPTEDDIDAAVEGWVIAEALRRLSADHRQVIHALYYEGRTVTDAAVRLGIPAGTVKSRSYYAVRALRVVLEEMGVLR
jgi:RNA polymerase sigma-70 factor, ECF subfamily